MKRIALVFIIAILIPSLLLAGLAVRTLRMQEVVLSNQRALLHQSTCDGMAANINLFMDDVRIFYGRMVDELVSERGDDVIGLFDQLVTERWSQAAVGAVVTDAGLICSPTTVTENAWAVPFIKNHSDFLSNTGVVEVYQAPKILYGQVEVTEEAPLPEPQPSSSIDLKIRDLVGLSSSKARSAADNEVEDVGSEFSESATGVNVQAMPAEAMEDAEPQVRRKVAASNSKLQDFRFEKPGAEPPSAQASQAPSAESLAILAPPLQTRNVEPRQQQQEMTLSKEATEQSINEVGYNYSRLNTAAVTQNDLTAEEEEGAVSRIIDGELHILLWKRHGSFPGHTFWVELNQGAIRSDLAGLFEDRFSSVASSEVSLALLGSHGELVTQTQSGFLADWATPFVAAEVGQILPRWEVAAYLIDPDALSAAAKTVLFSLSLTIITLVGAVAIGGFLIMRSVNSEMQLAARKTDFVSNVSHELKTPLTSIRMFSELLEGSESYDSEQTRKYSGVISKESARLTRLINRLLDFSQLDRGEMKLREDTVDLGELVQETVDNYRPQIEAEGLELELSIGPALPVYIKGDEDALSQVLVNLFSNAEKYAASGAKIEVDLENAGDDSVQVSVRDRGPGISKHHQRRIFEKFYRADESISSGIEGSGIGLALCRQIIDKHGGEIRYSKREGGGSTFSIELPISQNS